GRRHPRLRALLPGVPVRGLGRQKRARGHERGDVRYRGSGVGSISSYAGLPPSLKLRRASTERPRRSLLTRRSPPSDEGGWRSRDPAIHLFKKMDARVKPAHDEIVCGAHTANSTLTAPPPRSGRTAACVLPRCESRAGRNSG